LDLINEYFGLVKRQHLSTTAEDPTVRSHPSSTAPNGEAAMQELEPLATLLVIRGREARPLFSRLLDDELIDSLMRVFASIQTVVLKSLIAGILLRYKLRDLTVRQTTKVLLLASMNQRTMYNIAPVNKLLPLISSLKHYKRLSS